MICAGMLAVQRAQSSHQLPQFGDLFPAGKLLHHATNVGVLAIAYILEMIGEPEIHLCTGIERRL